MTERPTREAILAEPAGPQMDAWVSEFCFGLEVHDNQARRPGTKAPRKHFWQVRVRRGVWLVPPAYSTDISQAIGAAEEMVEKGHIRGACVWVQQRASARVHRHGRQFVQADGERPAHALARALLLAVVDQKEPQK